MRGMDHSWEQTVAIVCQAIVLQLSSEPITFSFKQANVTLGALHVFPIAGPKSIQEVCKGGWLLNLWVCIGGWLHNL